MPSGNKTLGFGVMRGTCTLSYSEAGLYRGRGAGSLYLQPTAAMAVSGCLLAVIF